MSRMEVNKGKLIPFKGDIEKLAEDVVPDSCLRYYDDKLEALKENTEEYGDYAMINGKLYVVVWECRAGDMEDGFAEVNEGDDGSISFYTYHYNGGGHWTEVVEGGLR